MKDQKRYPVGEQSFQSLREGNYIYVDKTSYIRKILEGGKYYFLGRPRRFGKSLFLSTLKCFFEGKRHLFEGLYVDSIDWTWEKYPVLHLDFNLGSYDGETDDLGSLLENMLSNWEREYDISENFGNQGVRLNNIIKSAYQKTGKKVVILVDEYDKPLVNNLNNKENFNSYRTQLNSLYSSFKSSADYIQLVFLTGVSRFGKLSVFSGLNNIQDISFDSRFGSICGITSSELTSYFSCGLQEYASKKGISYDECEAIVRKWYDGYHFVEYGEDIYNPFSLLCFLDSQRLSPYWMTSGGKPTLLIESLKNYNGDLSQFFKSQCSQEALLGIDHDSTSPLPLFYQTGYLTIKRYDEESDIYTLGLPNYEVKKSFMNYLLPYYANLNNDDSAFVVSEFVKDFRDGNVDGFMKRLQSLFGKVPNLLRLDDENNFHNALFILMMLVGLNVQAEYSTSYGRIDLFVATDKFYYIIELKVDKTPEEALLQIEDKQYALPFGLDGRKIIKIGANFSTETRTLTNWIVSEN